jgi:hypothetical protein
VPYITITVLSGTVIGRTVDATIGATPGRVTLLSEQTLRIEPDEFVGSLLPLLRTAERPSAPSAEGDGPEPVLYGSAACLKKR